MSAVLSICRRHRLHHLIRHLCTTTTPPPPLSSAAAKARLRREFDPDRAVSLLASIPSSTFTVASSRYALALAARRLARSRRYADAAALLTSHLDPSTHPDATSEPYLSGVLHSFASASLPDAALSAFRSQIPILSSPPTAHSFNAVLSAFLRSRNKCRRVPALFSELSQEFSITPDAISYGILIKSHCLAGDDSKAFEVLKQMRDEKGVKPTTMVYTTIIDSFYKQGKTEDAERVWKDMVESGCVPDNAAFNVKAMHYSLHGKPEEVLRVMQEMEDAGLKPDTITYNFLITCYFNNGMVDEAKEVYKALVTNEKGCLPNAGTYKYVLARLCANGEFEAGLEVFKNSLRKNKVPDFQTMKGLVEGLVKQGKVEEAEMVVREVKKKFPGKLLQGWQKVEKELGLNSDSGEVSPQSDPSEVNAMEKKVESNSDVEELAPDEEGADRLG